MMSGDILRRPLNSKTFQSILTFTFRFSRSSLELTEDYFQIGGKPSSLPILNDETR